jgi:tetratricopeptide (TPR) repeat protein
VNTQNNLGIALQGAGNHRKARELLENVHLQYLRNFGANHRNTLAAAQYLARSMIATKNTQDAEELLNEALERSVTALGETDPTTQRLRAVLGQCYGKTGRYKEGERLILVARKSLADRYGEDSGAAAWCGGLLAELYRAWERPIDAAKWDDGHP